MKWDHFRGDNSLWSGNNMVKYILSYLGLGLYLQPVEIPGAPKRNSCVWIGMNETLGEPKR